MVRKSLSLCVCVCIYTHACMYPCVFAHLSSGAKSASTSPSLRVPRKVGEHSRFCSRGLSVFDRQTLVSGAEGKTTTTTTKKQSRKCLRSFVRSFVRSCCSPSLTRNVSSLFLSQIQSNHPKQAGASKRVLQAKQKKFNSNIHKRGMVDINSSTKDKEKFTVGPVVLAFFIFVVIGSSLLQMIRTLQTGKP